MSRKKYLSSFLLLGILFVPLLSVAGSNGEIRIKVAIFSNSADLETALDLRDFLLKIGFDASVFGAKDFNRIVSLGEVDVAIILGGPLAYEGIGEISALYLDEDVKRRLVKEKGFYGYWIRDIVDEVIVCIVIAGDTREGTKRAEEEYKLRGVDETILKVSVSLNRDLGKEEVTILREKGFEILLFKGRTLLGRASLRSISEISELPFVEEISPICLSDLKVVLVVVG